MDKFVETQLNIFKLEEGLRRRFQDFSEEQFRNLTYEDLQGIFPEKDNKRLRTKLLDLIEDLEDNEVNIAEEVIRVERPATNHSVKMEVKEEPVDNDNNESQPQPSCAESSGGGILDLFSTPPNAPNIKQENLGDDDLEAPMLTSEISIDISDTIKGGGVNVKLEPGVVSSESRIQNNEASSGSTANQITTTIVGTDSNSTLPPSVGNDLELKGQFQENSNSVEVASSGVKPRTLPATESTSPAGKEGRKRACPSETLYPLSTKSIATASLIPIGDKIINSPKPIATSSTQSRNEQKTALDCLLKQRGKKVFAEKDMVLFNQEGHPQAWHAGFIRPFDEDSNDYMTIQSFADNKTRRGETVLDIVKMTPDVLDNYLATLNEPARRDSIKRTLEDSYCLQYYVRAAKISVMRAKEILANPSYPRILDELFLLSPTPFVRIPESVLKNMKVDIKDLSVDTESGKLLVKLRPRDSIIDAKDGEFMASRVRDYFKRNWEKEKKEILKNLMDDVAWDNTPEYLKVIFKECEPQIEQIRKLRNSKKN